MSGNTDDFQPFSFGSDSGSGSSDFISISSSPSSSISLSPTPSHTEILSRLPTQSLSVNSTTVMSPAIPPLIYLIAVPVSLIVLLSILIILICCIFIYYRLRKKRSHSRGQNLKHTRNSQRADHTKSLEGYSGNSSNSLEKSEGATQRYELYTKNGKRISSTSVSSPTGQYSSKTLPATTTPPLALSSNHTYNNTPHSPSMDAIYPHTSRKLSPHTTSPLHHAMQSPKHDNTFHLQKIPEHHHIQEQSVHTSHGVVSSKAGSSLPNSSTSDVFSTADPTSLYDVPSNALLVGSSPVNMPSSESSHLLYDVPKDALIATGHYKVPPLALNNHSIPLSPDAVYDVPSATAIYDVPPDVYHYYNQQDLYDVPPNSVGMRPRLNSQPTSQKELFEVRKSFTGNPTADYDHVVTKTTNVGEVPDYSHYDIPRNLIMMGGAISSQPSQWPPQEELGQSGNRLSRRNSNPIPTMLYDVPRNALLAEYKQSRPPTAPKPTRGRRASRSHSISSTHDYRSPEHTKPYKNAHLYKAAPLDPELLARHKKQSTSSEAEATNMRNHLPRQQSIHTHSSSNSVEQRIAVSPRRSSSVKKNKVPPPTKIKPGRGESIRK